MVQGLVVKGAVALLILSGVAFLLGMGASDSMVLFGGGPLPDARVGDPAWVGLAFARVLGAALVAIGLVLSSATRLPTDAGRAIGKSAMWGLVLLSVVTLAQAQAIWSTPAGWVLSAILVFACAASALLGFSARGATSP